jgi:aryl-alcohol dehydrogenase-like predicted oxidoreductase
MHYRRLGKSNLQVSNLCLGAMMFGDQTGAQEAGEIVAHAKAAGVNFIDTADVYTKGASERMLAPCWPASATTGCWPASWQQDGRCAQPGHYSRKWMVQEVESSLQRLQTDHWTSSTCTATTTAWT